MIDISTNNLIKSFEIGNNILDGLTFTINEGEHVAILGKNGSGKTTLFKILTGEYDYDNGSVTVNSSKRLGLISQIPSFPKEFSTDDVLRSSKKSIKTIEKKLSELETLMEADSSPSILSDYDKLLSKFLSLGGYDADADIEKVAAGLDISNEMRIRPFVSLSGGEQTRVNLARLILEDTDILLLDEPTNHLDLRATLWLEDYVNHFKGTVLIVSHDRYFLDTTAQRCIEIINGKAELYSGNYSFFVEERQRRFEEKLKRYEKDQDKLNQLTKAADQLHLWAFMGNDKLHKRAFSIEKRIEKLKLTERPDKDRKINVKFKDVDFYGDEALVLSHISKSYGERNLFKNLSLEITGGESLGIIGENGCGKSTLLGIILNQIQPDSGWVYLGPQIKVAFLPQVVRFQDENRSLVDTMLYESKCTPQDARDRLASFGFRGEFVHNKVKNLSGGERSRLKLCILMGENINLLILDEPTNHLDIASREWIEDALMNYSQTLIFVSHDRFFIDKFATRILSFEDKGITDYKGTYKQYLEWIERQKVFDEHTPVVKRAKSESKSSCIKKKKKNRSCSEESLERKISAIESKLYELKQEEEENSSDYVKLMELEEIRLDLESQVEELYSQLELTLS